MKNLELNQMEIVVGGDDFDHFVGGLACGAFVATLFFGGIGIIAAQGV